MQRSGLLIACAFLAACHAQAVPVPAPHPKPVAVAAPKPAPVPALVVAAKADSVQQAALRNKSAVSAKLDSLVGALNAARAAGFVTDFYVTYDPGTGKYKTTKLVLSATF
jgi:hypothetical protein